MDPKSILDFLLETRKLKTVIGCQNTSSQITYNKYLSNEAFFQEEFSGVTHLLEKFFFTLGSTNN